MSDKENLFEALGLETKAVKLEDINLGQEYPIYGLITAYFGD